MNIRTLLAILASDVGHPAADEAQRGVIADLERITGPDSPPVLVARSNLAKLVARLGRAGEAAPHQVAHSRRPVSCVPRRRRAQA